MIFYASWTKLLKKIKVIQPNLPTLELDKFWRALCLWLTKILIKTKHLSCILYRMVRTKCQFPECLAGCYFFWISTFNIYRLTPWLETVYVNFLCPLFYLESGLKKSTFCFCSDNVSAVRFSWSKANIKD